MVLTEEDKAWIGRDMMKDLTYLQVKVLLQKANYKDEKIDEFLNYYIALKELEQNNNKRTKQTEKEERKFEESVRSYYDGKVKDLSWSERRAVKKFMKNVNAYLEIIKKSTEKFREEIKKLGEKGLDEKRMEREFEYLKMEIIDRLIDSKELLVIENPITGEEATKENLKELDLDTLLELMDENVKELTMVVEGKI